MILRVELARVAALIAACALPACARDVPVNSQSGKMTVASYPDRLQERLARSYRAMKWNPERSVVIGVLDGSRTVVASFGHVTDGAPSPPTADTLFEIGSVTKVLTGALLARDLVAGKVRLDEPVQALLPELHLRSYAGKQVELQHLATYSAGYPWMPTNWVSWRDAAAYSARQWKTFLESFELPREPGSHFEYGNVGFRALR